MMASGPGSNSSSRISPRKFSEKIALLNKKEREANAKFEEIIKEVQATRSQPQQPTVNPANSTSQIIADEMQSMIESTRYQAAHSDSLEEIEKVYENLMKCVGQCDNSDAATNQRVVEANKHYSQQQFIDCNQDEYTLNGAKGTRMQNANSNGVGLAAAISTTTAPLISSTLQFYSQANNQFQGANIDLNSQQRQVSQSADFIPCEPSTNKNHFSGHNTFGVCVSSSHLPQIQQEACDASNQTRARVVSFGSASVQKYRCAGANNQTNQEQTGRLCDQIHPYQVSHCPTQYLKEPSGDRSRQKSSSDPQLHVAPAHYPDPVISCKSNNRLAMASQIASDTQTGTGCLGSNSGSRSHQQLRKSHIPDHQYKQGYFIDKISSSELSDSSHELHAAARDQPNHTLTRDSNLDCGQSHVSTTSQIGSQHQYGLCDTTNARGELPGIKICAIEDSDQSCMRVILNDENNRGDAINGNERDDQSSHDRSLPDISNLQFGNNSARTSPERHVYHQKDWPTQSNSYCSMNQITSTNIASTVAATRESCQALDGGWTAYGCQGGLEINMEAQNSDQTTSMSDQHRLEQRNSYCWLNSSAHQQPLHQALKTNNILSNSDCGFTTSSCTHHQQGNLIICTSSDLCNNIFRSRSHSNIDYLAKQNEAKRNHSYANDFQQFEQHHTSQYCLQNDQPVMNVRRVAELKAQGTSTSPLSSSSNLNSPQSEINSPGSSTTEQCESGVIFSSPTPHQDYYPLGTTPIGSNAIVVDESRIIHYAPGSTLIKTPHHQKQDASSNQGHQCIQIIQAPIREDYIEQNAQQAPHSCQPAAVPCSQATYNDVISPSSSSKIESLTYNNNEDNNQRLD